MPYRSLIATVIIAMVVQLAIFFLKLGYFLFFAWGVGLLLTMLATSRTWHKQKALLLMIVPLYCLSVALAHKALFDHRRVYIQPMNWVNKGNDNEWKQPEIVFEFVDYPGQFIGIYSSDIADYLTRNGRNPVSVSFEVTSDLGCVRGFRETRIGDLEKWRSAWGYASSNGSSAYPWKSRSWCGG